MQDNRHQLFILPYAGGSIAAFKKLVNCIDESIETITVEYAGRGSRFNEPFAKTIWELLDDACEYILERRNPNSSCSLMGYSMGSILAYEMLARNKVPGKVSHLFIAAEISPVERSLSLEKVSTISNDYILDRARKLGGLDETLIDNKRFKDIYIQPLISDYKLFYEYRFKNFSERIKLDTTFFFSERDTAKQEIERWEELLVGKFDYHEFGDNHFFINQYYQPMAKIINDHLCNK